MPDQKKPSPRDYIRVVGVVVLWAIIFAVLVALWLQRVSYWQG